MIVGNIDVDPSVSVIIGRTNTHSSSINVDNAHPGGNILKSAVSVVAVEIVGLGIICHWAGKSVGGVVILVIRIECQEVTDINVEKTVIIKVKPCCTNAAFITSRHSGTFCNVGKCPVAVVPEKNIGSVIANEKVGVAVVVDICR